MLKQSIIVATAAVALMASAPSRNNALGEERGRKPSVILAQYRRPVGYVHYRVWYTSRRMNYWAVYTETPNRRWAENASSMLVGLGYDTWVEPFFP